jgi:hypothetical protein
MDTSIRLTDETSEHVLDLRVIAKVQQFAYAKVRDQIMLATFLDKQYVIHKGFVYEGQTVLVYFEFIVRMFKSTSRERPQF